MHVVHHAATGARSACRAQARLAVLGACCALLVAACGDDADDDAAATTLPATTDDTAPAAAAAADEAYCDLAREIADQFDFPSAEQLRRYRDLAPDDISDAVAVAAPPLIEADRRPVEYWIAFGDDAVEDAIFAVDQFEAAACGIEHAHSTEPSLDGQPEDGAAAVEVTATDHAFALDREVAAGRTSFVVSNEGEAAHFLVIQHVLEGTIADALAFDGDPEAAGLVEQVGFSGVAAPGGDTEVATVDLEPGEYALVCLVPDADFTPHALLGMALPFTIS